MPLPPVVIELAQAEAEASHAGAMVEACSRSLPDRGCRLRAGSADTAEAPPAAIAIVRRRGEVVFVIELGLRRGDGSRWVERELSFDAEDPPEERWRAVGLVIGTLVGEADAAESKPNEPRRAPKPKVVPRSHHAGTRAPEASRPPIWLGVDAMAGPALDDGTWRFGIGVRTDYRPSPTGPFAMAGLRFWRRPEDDTGLSVDFAGGALGGGVAAEATRSLSFEVGASVWLETIRAAVDEPASGARDAASRWIAGGRLHSGALVTPLERLGLWVGVEAGWAARSVRVTVRSSDVGATPTATYGFLLGLRAGVF